MADTLPYSTVIEGATFRLSFDPESNWYYLEDGFYSYNLSIDSVEELGEWLLKVVESNRKGGDI